MEKCLVRGCKGKNAPNIKLFRFPKSNGVSWCHNLKISPDSIKKSTRICSRHFSRECFGHEKLRTCAIPTLELGHNDESLSLHYPIIVEPKPIIRARKCHVKDCTATDPPHKLYGFPHVKEKREEWITICQVPRKHLHLRSLFICKMHFRPDMIGKDRLRAHAVPFPYNVWIKAKLEQNSELRCHVKGCKEPDMQNKLHELPTEKNLRHEWIANCNIDEKYLQLLHIFICKVHFQLHVIDRLKQKGPYIPPINVVSKNATLVKDKPMALCNVEVPIREEIMLSDEIMIKEEFLSNDEYSDEEIESVSTLSNEHIMTNNSHNLNQNDMVNREIVCMNTNLTNKSLSKVGNAEIIINAANLDTFDPRLCTKEIDTVLSTEKIKHNNIPEHKIEDILPPSLCILKTESYTITEVVCENCGQSRELETQMRILTENFQVKEQMFLKRIQDLENQLKLLKTNAINRTVTI